jgi:hypothetical protein
MMKNKAFLLFIVSSIFLTACASPASKTASNATPSADSTVSRTYPIVDTAQGKCYKDSTEITCLLPRRGSRQGRVDQINASN